MIWKPTNYKKTNLRSVSEKGFLQDVRHNLGMIFQTRSGIQNEKSGLRRLTFFTAIFLNVSFMRVAIVIMLYGPHVFWCRKTKLHM